MLSYLDDYKKSFTLKEFNYNTFHDEYNNINKIFLEEIEYRKYDKQNYTQITKIYNSSRSIKKMKDGDRFISSLANKYLIECGLEQNTNSIAIEYWRHRLFGEKTSHTFSKHRDSFGILLDNVNTCIFYLRKDKTFNGGNLEIYGKGSYVNTNKILQTIIPNNNILCFDGDIYHKVSDFSGFGIRDCIVIQFSRKK